MNVKNRPNHQRYIATLRRMKPEQRLAKAFELSELGKRLFVDGLRRRFPHMPEPEFKSLVLRRLEKCYNRNY